MEMFATQMYGGIPGKPQELSFEVVSEDGKALDGAATQRRVRVHSANNLKEQAFETVMYIPNSALRAHQRAPLLLLIDNRRNAATHPAMEKGDFWPVEQLMARGYATAAFGVWDLAPDDPQHFREGMMKLFDDQKFGALSAWGWGASRIMDYL